MKATKWYQQPIHLVTGVKDALLTDSKDALLNCSKDVLTRPEVRGKFFYVGDEKLWIRGVTYGTFRPDQSGNEYSNPEVVEKDFTQMVAVGINVIRIYTPPPKWLLGCHGSSILPFWNPGKRPEALRIVWDHMYRKFQAIQPYSAM